jgi:hypothetical protein
MSELTIESMSDCFGECWEEPPYRPELAKLANARMEAHSQAFHAMMERGRAEATAVRKLT